MTEAMEDMKPAEMGDPFTPSYNADGTLTNPTKTGLGDGEVSQWEKIAGIFSKEFGIKEETKFRFKDKKEGIGANGPIDVVITGVELGSTAKAGLKGDSEGGILSNILGGVSGLIGGAGGAGGFVAGLSTIGLALAGALAGVVALSAGIFGIGKAIEWIDSDKLLTFLGGLADLFQNKVIKIFDYFFANKENIVYLFKGVFLPILKELVEYMDNNMDRVFGLMATGITLVKDGAIELAGVLSKTLDILSSTYAKVVETMTDGIDSITGKLTGMLTDEKFTNMVISYTSSMASVFDSVFGEGSALQTTINIIPSTILAIGTTINDFIERSASHVTTVGDTWISVFKAARAELQGMSEIKASNLFAVAGGITAIVQAMALQTIGTTVDNITGMFTRLTGADGPFAALRKIGDIAPHINSTAVALARIHTLIDSIGEKRVVLDVAEFDISSIKQKLENARQKIKSDLKIDVISIGDEITKKLNIQIDKPISVDVNVMENVSDTIKKTSRVKAKLLDEQVTLLKRVQETLMFIAESSATPQTRQTLMQLQGGPPSSNTFLTKEVMREVLSR
tara:strand:- start:40201 stop:41901 length:1701 start_codon:yes stop_codon:yes gene_type:complete